MLRAALWSGMWQDVIFEGFAEWGWCQDKAFERGYHSKTVQDTVDGSGLGLAIVREMTTHMGGRIDVLESEGPSKLDGTTLRIILFCDQEWLCELCIHQNCAWRSSLVTHYSIRSKLATVYPRTSKVNQKQKHQISNLGISSIDSTDYIYPT